MDELFPDETNNYLKIYSLSDKAVHFAAQDINGKYVGCGAFVLFSDYAEIKSMFVDPNYRGKRIGDALLVHMLGTMADNSVPVVRLETGTLLKSALNLYRKHGFQYCDALSLYCKQLFCVHGEKIDNLINYSYPILKLTNCRPQCHLKNPQQ